MSTTYSPDSLRVLFQSKFALEPWSALLIDLFGATELKATPERINQATADEGYYLGCIDTSDSYRIGLFKYSIADGSVANKRVGLRNLVKSFINPTWGEFDAALVVFDSGDHWRLSFICDIKGEVTSPKRYTYVFGDRTSLYKTPVERFSLLKKKGVSFASLKDAFSVEALTEQFYKDLFEWYQWAVGDSSNVTFPNNTAIEEDDKDDIEKKIIRLITRIMFVWFIKQKDLVPNRIFDIAFLSSILKDFDPHSTTVGNYYNAILQNLFFGTLNRAIKDENGNTRKFATSSKRDVKTLYRYAEMFSISEQDVIDLFAEIPFLNGGLFECLDKTRYIDGVEQCYNFDGFSRNDSRFSDGRFKHRAVVPNNLFFAPEKGLISILSRYNFTIEENSPEEQLVALDPELLGKVFENLLGAYNPETSETARNQSGSFYTPREIVNYMVDESLIAYLGDNAFTRSLFRNDFSYDSKKTDDYQNIAEKLKAVKVLDPACGSGAFPMGLLNRMINILELISPNESIYDLKLSIIENCLYGSDIQSIAAQITKLRFFISLICDCEKDVAKPNFGIPTLPNLETKFVSANSLIAKKNRPEQGSLFENPEIEATKEELSEIRHKHFAANSASAKQRLREKDQALREKLATLLADDDNFAPEDAKQLAAWNPYDQNAVSPFFDPEWMFNVVHGFDIVIGNPPYNQLQKNGGELAKLYEHCDYSTFDRTSDIYCLFYERGYHLLKEHGHLCYITSNKWMRAGYGEKTRAFFAKKTNPILLIDFAGVKIFESATVDTNIILFAKANNLHKTLCAVTNKQNTDCVKNLSDFVQQEQVVCDFDTSESWVILSPIEQSIKKKIEAVGTPLKDWDISIYRGVLTGCNDAFIIDTDKRDEILANCQSDEEREKTAELIRPILRGRDIKRYGYEWEKWIICARVCDDIPQNYPAVSNYLSQYRIKGKLGDNSTTKVFKRPWWAWMQEPVSYWEDFSKPKIVWIELSDEPKFALADKTMLLNTVFFMTGEHILHLLGLLNSKLITWYFIHCLGTTSGVGTNRWLKYTIEQIPMVAVCPNLEKLTLSISHNYDQETNQCINLLVCQLYHLNDEEVMFIESL